jgi:adenine-specific DNA-methyltransferase
LRENGAIFVSCDDQEVHHLRKIGDSLWQAIGTFVWEKKKKGSHLSPTFRDLTEYILAYTPDLSKIGQLFGEKAYAGEWQRLINRANAEGELLFPARKVHAELDEGTYPAGTYGNGEMAVHLLDDISVQDGTVQNQFRMRARFKWKQETLDKELERGTIVKLSRNIRPNVLRADQEGKTKRPPSLITKDIAAYEDAFAELTNLFGDVRYPYPKPVGLVRFFIKAMTYFSPEGIVLDFFAGSGTTGQAVINLNREDGGRRKYILVEMGEYFDTVLVPRIKKVVYSKDWKDGKPVSREGSSHMFKVIRLESYEDTLNNLEPKRTEQQNRVLFPADPDAYSKRKSFREDYMLHYMLDVESRGSPSLLNLDRFEDPFSYKLNIATGTAGETKPTVVDLVETFNYLIGLRVKTMHHTGGVWVVTGTNPQGERVLILWRNIKETDNDKLDDWFQKQGYNTKDQEYDVIYVNGDNNLENLKKPEQTWKVRLIEEEFLRRMFDVQDI